MENENVSYDILISTAQWLTCEGMKEVLTQGKYNFCISSCVHNLSTLTAVSIQSVSNVNNVLEQSHCIKAAIPMQNWVALSS